MRPMLAFATLLLVSPPALARDLDGVHIPDTLTVTGEKPADANLKHAALGDKDLRT